MDLLERHVRLFKKMKELATEQQTCLEEDRLDAYFHLSGERERVRSQIVLNEKRAGWNENKGREGLASAARKRAAEIVKIIRSIQETDACIAEMLIRKKESLASEIRDLKKGRQAVRGYDQRLLKPARFIDRKS